MLQEQEVSLLCSFRHRQSFDSNRLIATLLDHPEGEKKLNITSCIRAMARRQEFECRDAALITDIFPRRIATPMAERVDRSLSAMAQRLETALPDQPIQHENDELLRIAKDIAKFDWQWQHLKALELLERQIGRLRKGLDKELSKLDALPPFDIGTSSVGTLEEQVAAARDGLSTLRSKREYFGELLNVETSVPWSLVEFQTLSASAGFKLEDTNAESMVVVFEHGSIGLKTTATLGLKDWVIPTSGEVTLEYSVQQISSTGQGIVSFFSWLVGAQSNTLSMQVPVEQVLEKFQQVAVLIGRAELATKDLIALSAKPYVQSVTFTVEDKNLLVAVGMLDVEVRFMYGDSEFSTLPTDLEVLRDGKHVPDLQEMGANAANTLPPLGSASGWALTTVCNAIYEEAMGA